MGGRCCPFQQSKCMEKHIALAMTFVLTHTPIALLVIHASFFIQPVKPKMISTNFCPEAFFANSLSGIFSWFFSNLAILSAWPSSQFRPHFHFVPHYRPPMSPHGRLEAPASIWPNAKRGRAEETMGRALCCVCVMRGMRKPSTGNSPLLLGILLCCSRSGPVAATAHFGQIADAGDGAMAKAISCVLSPMAKHSLGWHKRTTRLNRRAILEQIFHGTHFLGIFIFALCSHSLPWQPVKCFHCSFVGIFGAAGCHHLLSKLF